MASKEQIKKLSEPMPYKWRVQSSQYGKSTVVSYCDSRQVQQMFDDCLGATDWQNVYVDINGQLFCGISVKVDNEDGRSEWITKYDGGTENKMEKEKSQISDSLKRAAVLWGCGRFLYSLGIITLKSKKHTNDKDYPTTDEGQILWNTEDLAEYCKKVVASGELDRTKPNVKPLEGSKPTATPTVPATPVTKVTPTQTEIKKEVVSTQGSTGTGSALQPSKEFDDPKVKALEMIKALDQPKLIKHLVSVEKIRKYTDAESFVKGESIEKIREVYTAFTTAK